MKPLLDASEHEVQVWPSYTDVAMNIVLILLIYLFAQAVAASQTTAELVGVQERQRLLEKEILESLPEPSRHFVTLRADGNLLKCSFSDRVLFDLGKAELKPEGARLLEAVGTALRRNIDSFSQIQIEGHTDTIPIRTLEFRSNWELSSARATSVVRHLQERADIDPAKLSATGYSEYHPVDDADTEEGRSRNRRIEMVIVYSLHGDGK